MRSEDMNEEERKERAGCLETDEHDLVNRKKPNQLSQYMNASKRPWLNCRRDIA